ncbi:MAG: flagellar hook-basal body complex protein [Zetaproteobacteria bacterium]|nr:MAG: flagellar hook-basal body complex protein [Zetaproteobacteria bacterium]
MGMYSSIYTAKSGMMAFSQGTNVIGDNLANSNTVGFKGSTLLFSDVMTRAAGAKSFHAAQAAAGVRLAKVGRDMRQGQVEHTTNGTDMAISGAGMFALRDPVSGNTFYSRAGHFLLDKNFKLVNEQGMIVQGWQKSATGATIGTKPVDIDIGLFSGASPADLANNRIVIAATPSTTANIGVTLPANAVRPSAPLFDPNDPTSYNFKTDLVLFDANGTKHTTSLYFVKQGMDANGNAVWDWHLSVKGDELTGGTANDANTQVEVGGSSYTSGAALPAGTLPQGTVIAPSTTLSAAVTGAFTLIDQNGNSAAIPAGAWTAGTTLAAVAANAGLANTGFYRIGSGGITVPAATVGGTSPLIQLPATPSTVTGGVVDPAVATAQRLEFDGTGALVNEYAPTVSIPWNGAAAGAISLNMGSATTIDAQGTTGTGTDGTLQVGDAFAATSVTSDGYAQGTLDRLETDATGVIYGLFTNGRRVPLAQVALAAFGNPAALERMGGNLLQASAASGKATMQAPTTGGMGTIIGSGLEQSNVDLGDEFVKLIVLQRSFEANSKSLTTTDQMLSMLAQLKR